MGPTRELGPRRSLFLFAFKLGPLRFSCTPLKPHKSSKIKKAHLLGSQGFQMPLVHQLLPLWALTFSTTGVGPWVILTSLLYPPFGAYSGPKPQKYF